VPSLEGFGIPEFFVLRTPLLPFDEFLAWGDSLKGEWRADVEVLRIRLREIVGRPEVQQALYLASPSLFVSIPYWEEGPDSRRGLQTERALVRYFARMCGRPTPFALLSGSSTGTIGEQSGLLFGARQHYKAVTRLSYEYLLALTDGLKSTPDISSRIRYWPNSSLIRIGTMWHYREIATVNGCRVEEPIRVQNDDYLDLAIQRARHGATIAEIAEALRPAGVSHPEAAEYVMSLISAQILVSELEPPLTGDSPLDDFRRQIAELPALAPAAVQLERARAAITAIARKGLGAGPVVYESLTPEVGNPVPSIIHVDMIKPFATGVLPTAVVDELGRAMRFLCIDGISPAEEPPTIRAFRESFVERFGHAWVPLLEALDEERGVGFGRIALPPHRPALTRFQARLLQEVMECAAAGRTEIVLQDTDFQGRAVHVGALPDAFSVRAAIGAQSMEALRQGAFLVHLLSAAGPSGAAMLGRFCHANPELERHIRRHLLQEEALDPEAVYAEIVYLPDGRTANILSRPIFREYEIAYLGRSGCPQDRQIRPDDLLVTATPDERVLLYSQRLNKRVIPRLSAAHDFSDPRLAPFYRFLCYLQYQPRTNVPAVNWGVLEELPFLPRLRTGRVILSVARWRLSAEDVARLDSPDRSGVFAAVQALRRARHLPRWILYSEEDASLPVDLENPLSVDAFVHVLKRAGSGRVTEMWPTPDQLCVSGPEGSFQHEFIVPFVRLDAGRPAGIGPVVTSANRSAMPGGTWLYVKLYGGVAALDELVTTMLPLLNIGVARKWFFVRYQDPHHHLRLRFHDSPGRLKGELFQRIVSLVREPLSSKRLWKIQFDTYEREVERYGGPRGISTAESIFSVDSEAAIAVLQALGPHKRLLVAALGVDRMFRDFGFNCEERLAAVRIARNFVENTLRPDDTMKKNVSQAFRMERRELEEMLLGKAPAAILQAYETRSARLVPLVRRLERMERIGRLTRGVRDIVPSYVHMHVNRMMASTSATVEYTLYDFLVRAYAGWVARGRK
jgi:thiopeptide-type bacteriocin biosynthesis protein